MRLLSLKLNQPIFNNITNSAISPNIITANISGYIIRYFMCHGNNIILHKQYVCKDLYHIAGYFRTKNFRTSASKSISVFIFSKSVYFEV